MDKTKQPGIKFSSIYLKSVQFEVLTETFKNEKGLQASFGFQGSEKISEDKKHLMVELGIKINEEKKEGAPFFLFANFVGHFQTMDNESNLPLEDFAKKNAFAIMLPYIREFVSNITTRTPYPPLMIDPINIMALLEDQIKKQNIDNNNQSENQNKI